MERLGASLPSYKRVLGYEIWFEPLPRTTTGKLKRHEIVRKLKMTPAGDAPQVEASAEDAAWLDDAHVSAAIEAVRRRAAAGASCLPNANLELDLGLDSMERVELLTELEQQFGVDVPEATVHEIFTLRQLIEAVRPSAANAAGEGAGRPRSAATDESWALILRDLPPKTDPVLSGLLEQRTLLEPILFAFTRVAQPSMARVEARGLENLPKSGAYLICPNHQSYIDGFLVCGVLPRGALANIFFVGAIEYFETALMAWVARKVNIVPVDADSNLVPAMKAGAFGLAQGKILVLFPEGERSLDGTVKRFRKGAAILARHAGVPIVPVAIKGAHEVWAREGSFRWKGLLPWSRSVVKIEFGAPMQFGEGETYGDAAARLEARVKEMWARL
jgi:long-chain acyl-CoA synthetase